MRRRSSARTRSARTAGQLQSIEARFGRRRRGQRWRARVLDLDIVLWSGGAWASPGLIVPHVAFRERLFVLGPAAKIAGDWRDPVTGLSLRQLLARLKRS
jgi:2-amino-4-hydroxy-6-hydroxymethyldihydropteridine diphosphokinase